MLTFVSVSREPFRVPGLEADLLDAEVVTAKLDLLLSLVDREGAVGGHVGAHHTRGLGDDALDYADWIAADRAALQVERHRVQRAAVAVDDVARG